MKNHKETGAFAIETVLVLTFFMLSIISIMFMSVIIKVQANMQYAISQTAKEISGYYYLLDKLGLASLTAGTVDSETQTNISELDQTLSSLTDLMGQAEDVRDDFSDMTSYTDFINMKDDLNELYNDAQNLGDALIEDCKDGDAVKQMKAVLLLFGKTLTNKALSYYVAPFVCQALLPKYLTNGDIATYCQAAGLKWNKKNDGVNKEFMDFSGTQLLLDGRSIKIDVVYTINTKSLTFGLVDETLTFHQVATTAAWIRPNGNSIKALSEVTVPTEAEEATQSEEEEESEE